MKALLCPAYGGPEVLKLVDIEKPVPRPHEILIRVKASTVTFGDCELRNLTLPAWTRVPVRMYFGYNKPRRLIPGMEVAGIVEEVGSNVTNVKPGDAVFGSTGMSMGGNAEYVCRTARDVGLKPANVSFEDAATIAIGGINALHFLRKAKIHPGQRVLVIGGGGCIGSWAVQLSKYYGAEVTAVDHTIKLDMLRAIGSDHVIDYTKEDFSSSGIKYDVIFDVVYQSSFHKCVNTLTRNGYYLMANTDPGRMLRGLLVEMTSSRKTIFSLAGETGEDLNYLAGLIADNKIKPYIDRVCQLETAMEAHKYVEEGLKKGNLIIRVD